MTEKRSPKGIARVAVLTAVLLSLATFGSAAHADDSQLVTYVGTQTIPVPPASSYAGTGGGDGWSVALTPSAVYNVFHHSGSYQVACHKQSDASQCWASSGAFTVTGDQGRSFSSSGHSGVVVDQSSGKLYGFATDNTTGVGGVVCFDTKLASPSVDPFADNAASPFCGFTALTGAGEAVTGTSGLSEAVQVGSKLYSFDFYPGAAVGSTAQNAQNKLVCFDLSTGAACAGQPFPVSVGGGTNANQTFPAPGVAAFKGQIIIPITMGETGRLACFDPSTGKDCAGSWPLALGNYGSYPGSYAAPFAKLSSTGGLVGLCLPMPGVPCFALDGTPSATPANMPAGVANTGGWNGASVVVGPRVYIPHGYYPNGGPDQIECYDYNLGGGCPAFPKTFGGGLSLLYTVNADPQRPDCLWVNADGGTQIQNFDAFSGGACGSGAIRVAASSFVVDAPQCTPGAFTELRVVSPARSSYTSGAVKFVDASSVQLNVDDRPLDADGAASLVGVPVTTSGGLPQFLISLFGTTGAPASVTVDFTWTGTFDQACAGKGNSEIVNPPGAAAPPPPAPAVPPKTDVKVVVSAPAFVRTGQSAGYSIAVSNAGPDTATGVVLHVPIPAGATVTAATSSTGSCTRGASVTCFIGTLTSGAAATVNLAVSLPGAGLLTLSPSADGDYDTNLGNNSASASVAVLAPESLPPPPPPTSVQGTFNAIGSGTIIVNGVAHNADEPFVLHSGDVIDVTGGLITFTDSNGRYGSWSGTRFIAKLRTYGVAPAFAFAAADGVSSRFSVEEGTTPGAVTTLALVGGDFSGCTAPRRTAAKNQKPVQQLWGSAKGAFTTKGRFSAATVRGTVWMVQDRCDGTLTEVVEGIVDVFDSTKNTTVAVPAGSSYLAAAPGTRAPLKPPLQTPAQTPKQVSARGLRWGTKLYKTRPAFESFLKKQGQTWKVFAAAYPKLAAALASRR